MSDGAPAVIPSVIPPGTTPKTGGNQADGTADLTSMDVTGRHPMDGGEATSNPPADWGIFMRGQLADAELSSMGVGATAPQSAAGS